MALSGAIARQSWFIPCVRGVLVASAVSGFARTALPQPALFVLQRVKRAARPGPVSPLTSIIGEGRCEAVTIRPVNRHDSQAWTGAMRANAERMARWWSMPEGDLHTMTDGAAFGQHLHGWDARRRSGDGIALALVGPTGLFGELHVWHLVPGGLTCEIGIWMAPVDAPLRRAAGGAMGYAFDRLVHGVGIERIEAPVAAENPMPRRFLQTAGFEIDARIPRWREVQGHLADFDLFALTPERWSQARGTLRRIRGEWDEVRAGSASLLTPRSGTPAGVRRRRHVGRSVVVAR